ncbi:hypothetical protein H4R20_002848 [Coemansia guatemalensis]|uniref:Calcium-dependent phosphotriesterase n=1 Tax=Coemansia guatemalensis TaxID=2761395 RepID=A0A9W8HUE3_9FUNG|nr:hypothetical protein H4R20_002848 [Coemansia guatemalensis]
MFNVSKTLGLTRKLVLLALVALGGSFIYVQTAHVLNMLGTGKVYVNVNTTSCRQIGHGVLRGCEDIVVDPHTGLAYLACGSLAPRQHWLHPDDEYDFIHESETDHVYVMGEDDSYTEIRLLEPSADGGNAAFSQDLRVHGFDIFWDSDDPQRMTFMFVNHQLDHDAVSIFSYISGSDHMLHLETVKSELLWSANNIVAMSHREFYATNDMRFPRGIMREVSSNLRLADGHVVYRNHSGHFSVAASNIRYPNGIARHQDQIYVASCTDPGIQIYRPGEGGRLDYQGRVIYNDGIPDNLFADPLNGQIYSTMFLKVRETHKFFKHPSLDTTKEAGTKLLRFTRRSNSSQDFDIESLLIDSGELMPTATIAAVQRRNQIQRLLVGCVMCNFLVVCDGVI